MSGLLTDLQIAERTGDADEAARIRAILYPAPVEPATEAQA